MPDRRPCAWMRVEVGEDSPTAENLTYTTEEPEPAAEDGLPEVIDLDARRRGNRVPRPPDHSFAPLGPDAY